MLPRRTSRGIRTGKFCEPAVGEVAVRLQRTKIRDPQIVVAVHSYVPWTIHPSAVKAPDDRAVRSNPVNLVVIKGADPRISLGIDRDASEVVPDRANETLV